MDAVESYFAMRKVSVGKDERGITRILLNNHFTFMMGSLDQGFWPDGIYTAPTDEALRFDIEFAKRIGLNLARKHVKVEPQRWYYWCDKLGLLVWQDMPSFSPTPGYEEEMPRVIAALRNHPCIVLWVMMNEGYPSREQAGDGRGAGAPERSEPAGDGNQRLARHGVRRRDRPARLSRPVFADTQEHGAAVLGEWSPVYVR